MNPRMTDPPPDPSPESEPVPEPHPDCPDPHSPLRQKLLLLLPQKKNQLHLLPVLLRLHL